MFVRVVLFLFASLLAACSSEPVGSGFSAEHEAREMSGGESRPPPVMCEASGNVGTPDQELEAWQTEITIVRLAWARELRDRETGLRFARALRHLVNAMAAGESCHALSTVANYSESACGLQSLEARAIMRCHLDTLAARCSYSPDLIRRARFGLYRRGCDPGEGDYQP